MKKTKYNSSNKNFHLIIDPNENVITTNLDSIDYNDPDDSSPDLETIKELVAFIKNLIPNLEEKFGLKQEPEVPEEDEFDEINFGEVLEVITTKPQTKQEMLNHFTPKKKVKTEKKAVKSKSKEEVIESFNFEIDPNASYSIGSYVDFYLHDKTNEKYGWVEGNISNLNRVSNKFTISYQEGSLIKTIEVLPERMREKVEIKAPNGNIMRIQKIVHENSKKVEIYTPPLKNKEFAIALDNGSRSKMSDAVSIMSGGLSAVAIGGGTTDRTNSANVPMEQRSRV
jgi:TusA-related sulfurtransferase